jgi:FixJ family two-component response regulator
VAPIPRIAVVDDDPTVCKALGRLLGSAGLHVAQFVNAAGFLAEVATRTPDLLLLDVHMPVMSGLVLAAELRRRGYAFPIVFLTANEDGRAAVENSPVLAKPCDEAVLLKALRTALAENAPKPETTGLWQ